MNMIVTIIEKSSTEFEKFFEQIHMNLEQKQTSMSTPHMNFEIQIVRYMFCKFKLFNLNF